MERCGLAYPRCLYMRLKACCLFVIASVGCDLSFKHVYGDEDSVGRTAAEGPWTKTMLSRTEVCAYIAPCLRYVQY